MDLEVRIGVGEGDYGLKQGHRRAFWGIDCVLFLDLGESYMDVLTKIYHAGYL